MHVPVWCVSTAFITTASRSNINQLGVIANLAPLSAATSQMVLIRLVSTSGCFRLGTNPVTGHHAPSKFVASVSETGSRSKDILTLHLAIALHLGVSSFVAWAPVTLGVRGLWSLAICTTIIHRRCWSLRHLLIICDKFCAGNGTRIL